MSREKASARINKRISKSDKRKKISPTMVIIPVVLVVIIAVVLVVVISGKESSMNVVVTPSNVDKIISQMDDSERTPIGSYNSIMNTDWTFATSKSASSDAYVENSVANNNTIYFTIAMKGKKDSFYTSPYIPVGSHMKNINLNADLSAGVYDAVLTYHLVDTSYKDVSTVSVSITITISK